MAPPGKVVQEENMQRISSIITLFTTGLDAIGSLHANVSTRRFIHSDVIKVEKKILELLVPEA